MADKITPEDVAYNRRVKRVVVESLLEVCETFYLHCMPHPDLFLGNRGLIDQESKEGVVLVFGPYSARRLNWDDRGIDCDMHFSRWEPVHIPWECVHRAFDKAGQFLMQWVVIDQSEPILRDASKIIEEQAPPQTDKKEKSQAVADASAEPPVKVIKVDFAKRKKK